MSVLDLAADCLKEQCLAATAAKKKRSLKIAYVRPEESEALRVHPDDIPEAMALAKAKGVPTEHDSEGRPLFTSARHQQAYCRAFGFFNRDSVFSPKHH